MGDDDWVIYEKPN